MEIVQNVPKNAVNVLIDYIYEMQSLGGSTTSVVHIGWVLSKG
jgi:hypothetical protein